MIVIPESYKSDLPSTDRFIALLEIFNALEEDLEYPVCSSAEDRLFVLRVCHSILINEGYL